LIEEQILTEFKNKLQENDEMIEKLRKEHNEFEANYKSTLRKTKKEQNAFLKKTINDFNKEINIKTKTYNEDII
jgi:small-conductance mechanosensitive channel